DLERHLGAVDVVVLAEEHRGLDVDDRVARERPALHAGDDALLDRGNVLVRDDAALDLVDELELRAARQRRNAEVDFAELAATTALLLVAVVALGAALDRLAIRHVRLRQRDLDAEALLHPLDEDLEVEVAHALDERLLRALLVVAGERRILLVQPHEAD